MFGYIVAAIVCISLSLIFYIIYQNINKKWTSVLCSVFLIIGIAAAVALIPISIIAETHAESHEVTAIVTKVERTLTYSLYYIGQDGTKGKVHINRSIYKKVFEGDRIVINVRKASLLGYHSEAKTILNINGSLVDQD